ncbi:hypothetical protein AXG93_146s1370 [Marchantia polymorpha subsp. ruderalis]|uniref:Uncharacterized protein n=2 Tax=Marchantia polymorpha TaxID=3197 RepID=A0A176W7L5_MARPO|nr:hypothetical protein AXG93_146s1370 [Marchantia polymorpha subsp. ruderalis]
MADSSGFQERLQELTDTLQHRKHLLEAEKQMQSIRQLALQEANAKLDQIQRLTHDMKNKAEDMSSTIGRLETQRGAVHARLDDILHETRLLAEQIIDLEQQKDSASQFYEKNKEEMQTHQRRSQEHRSELELEINKLEKQMEELQRSSSERKRQISEIDAAIEAEEEKRQKMMSTKEEVIHEIASNSKKVEKAEAALEHAKGDIKRIEIQLTADVRARTEQVTFLRRENEYWEDQVFQRMRKRTQLQRDLEILENRVAEKSKVLYG